ncbi:hypothetical protein BH11PAT3_BH11PAT3_0550 [soil metagenome]
MRGTVDSIKERLDIVDVVGTYLKLDKTGQNYKGRCPFHNEKTGSFFVSHARQTYYCFGCGAKGDMFTLVQELEGVDFKGALKLLADRAGVEIEYAPTESRSEKDELYRALDEAALYYEEKLEENAEAKKYLEERGISSDSIKLWRIGYAPDAWRELSSHLVSIGHKKETLHKAGLLKTPDDTTKEAYDVFRGRIMFPLNDANGKVIAFSGRALKADAIPKYLNTPETVLFQKGEVLYGLDKAKEDIRKKNFAILVEGQMDLVMSHQVGVKNTVASSGTAFTELHLERLRRLSPRILLAFDGDEAGDKAAEKSAILGLSMGMEVKVSKLPKGKDPADLSKNSPDEWKEILRKATHSIEYALNQILDAEKDPRKIGKLIEKKVLPLLTLLESSIERSHFVSLISKKSGLREEVVWDDLRKTPRPNLIQNSPHAESGEVVSKEVPQKRPRKSHIERRLCGIILWQKSLPQPSIDITSLEGEVKKRVGDAYYMNLFEALTIETEALIFEAESYQTDHDALSRNIVELLDNLTDDMLREELSEKILLLRDAENQKNETLVEALGIQIQLIHRRMQELEDKRKMV